MTPQQRQMALILERLRPRIERIGGGGPDGEDLYGDVTLACLRMADRYDWRHRAIEGRVIRIARNLWVRHLRRQRVRRHLPLPAHGCPEVRYGEDPAYDDQEWRGRLQQYCAAAIRKMPDRYRHILKAHLLDGKPLVAIAAESNLPSGTVRSRYHRAKQRFKQELWRQLHG